MNLKISFNDHFGVGEKLKNFPAMTFDVSKHGIAGPAKGEKTHGGGNADVHSYHARRCSVSQLPNRLGVLGVDAGGIGKVPGVNQFNDIFQGF